jgi:diketogulonate reductase-like aldo/keto reductase
LSQSMLTSAVADRIRALHKIAVSRGQSLAQLALAWTLRDPRVTSVLIGASSVEQLDNNLGMLAQLPLDADTVAAIEPYAVSPGTGQPRPDVDHAGPRVDAPRWRNTQPEKPGPENPGRARPVHRLTA